MKKTLEIGRVKRIYILIIFHFPKIILQSGSQNTGCIAFIYEYNIKEMPHSDTSMLGSCEGLTRRSHNFPSILISTSLMAATAVVIYMYETTKLYDIAGYLLLPVLVFIMY